MAALGRTYSRPLLPIDISTLQGTISGATLVYLIAGWKHLFVSKASCSKLATELA